MRLCENFCQNDELQQFRYFFLRFKFLLLFAAKKPTKAKNNNNKTCMCHKRVHFDSNSAALHCPIFLQHKTFSHTSFSHTHTYIYECLGAALSLLRYDLLMQLSAA